MAKQNAPAKKKAKKEKQIGVRVTLALLKRLEDLAIVEDRAYTTLARMFIERGLAAYDRDGLTAEPGRQKSDRSGDEDT